ncbi:MAG: winged helix-turn-helix domain-containing protein [Burkholderiales bacterium]|nr:winged helix-turn-helix domain-containing protein [Burkholderiales bacterium]
MEATVPAVLQIGRLLIDPGERRLLVDGVPCAVGARAFDLLLALARHRDRVVTKAEPLDAVWPGLVVEENNLQVHVSALRKLLGDGRTGSEGGSAGSAIASVAAAGYRAVAADGAGFDGTSLGVVQGRPGSGAAGAQVPRCARAAPHRACGTPERKLAEGP